MIDSVGGFDNRTLIHHYSGLLMIVYLFDHVVFHILEKPRYDVLFNLQTSKTSCSRCGITEANRSASNIGDIRGNRSSNISEPGWSCGHGFHGIIDVEAIRSHAVFSVGLGADSQPIPHLGASLHLLQCS